MEEGEALVVLAGDHQVVHAGVAGHLDDGVGVEGRRVEPLGQFLIGLDRDLVVRHDPFADVVHALALPFPGQQAVQAPVDKQAEAGIVKAFDRCVLHGAPPRDLA